MNRMIKAIVGVFILLLGVSFAAFNIAATNAREYHEELLRTLLPGSESFTREYAYWEDPNIEHVHKGENGYVIDTVTRGYAGDLRMSIGVSKEGKVTGLVITDAHETFGLGSKALNDHVFLAQFLNKAGSFTIGTPGVDTFTGATATEADAGESIEVDGITGATVTSKAVARSVTSAVAFVTGADATSAATSWGG